MNQLMHRPFLDGARYFILTGSGWGLWLVCLYFMGFVWILEFFRPRRGIDEICSLLFVVRGASRCCGGARYLTLSERISVLVGL